ncbi:MULTISPECIES: efflux RND transporter permease subunit [unclassified Meiothermus]|uniref:efflux RND transporter permease subunit n=1 Tax=unclassified Meiothermus TaxID=370471 RepID=UPI000D7BAD9A|nr:MULTISPECIES: efflux RND transporter permease subunit [unclassified Meiothermus]PZA07729.1 AcrB/AcrD/AcrF family protein [Meiothermus sp. Pnk-1]RYM37499.1 efflux RND transporter permease subunit [Meiothermus sp. PNK-Is4]
MRPLKEFQTQLFNRVNPLVGFSVARYVFSVGIFAAVVAFGLLAASRLGVDLLPNPNIPVVAIFTSYPGASPEVVDKQVTQVIENSVSNLAGITNLNSSSSQGLSRVILQFTTGVDPNAVANQVGAQVSALARSFPSGVGAPSVRTFDPTALPILEFGLSGGGDSLEQVYDYAQNTLINILQRIDGVANVTLTGGLSRQFQVLLDPSRLAYYQITPQQVTQAILNGAVNQPIGNITRQGNTLTFATRNIPSNAEQLAQILVDSSRGLRVSDLGTVRDNSASNDYVRVNGQPVVLFSIQQTQGSNAVAVAQAVRQTLARTPLPQGYQITYSNDTTVPITASINATYHELLNTALVVAIVVLLFLGRLNTAFTVILAIPIALSAAPALYSLLGFTFNLVSLLALIVAIGIVVDDSIVVAENVERYRELGFSRTESVLKGASEVFSAVAAASLSLLSVVVPVSFLGGFAGFYLQQFSLGLAAAVFLSWFEALLFLTVRMAYTPDSHPRTWADLGHSLTQWPRALGWGWRAWRHWLGLLGAVVAAAVLVHRFGVAGLLGLLLYPLALGVAYYLISLVLTLLEALTTSLHRLTEAALSYVREGYAHRLRGLLDYSGWILAAAAAFFVLTVVWIGPKIPFNFVPQNDSGRAQVNLNLPSSTSIYTTNALAARLEGYLLSRPEVRSVQTQVSGNRASLTVQLAPRGERANIFSLIPQWQRALSGLLQDQPSARVFISAGGGFRGQGSALQVNLASPSLELLNARTNQALELLQADPNVLSATTSLSQTTVENRFIPDPSRMSGTGLTASSVAAALQTYTSGSQAGSVEVNGINYPIQVQLDPLYLRDAQSLLSLPIYAPALQTNLTVGQLGHLVQAQTPTNISRTNRLYTSTLNISLAPGAPSQLEFQRQLTQKLTQAGILDNQVSLGSADQFSQAALASQLSSLGVQVFALALFLVYLVMGAQFNSFRYPLYLLLPVPLAVAGALWAIFIAGGSLDIFSVMGFLLLIGLSAKNAILYLDFVVERLGKMEFREALVDAARLRFRPIVMTTTTVLVISFPLILGQGESSEYARGLGVVILGGVLFSAILTFFVVPAAFYLFERQRTPVEPSSVPLHPAPAADD